MSDQSLTEKEWDKKLSYSSFNLFMGCQKKYFLRKVKRVMPDIDATEDTVALRFGKAFHQLLEDAKHLTENITGANIKAACELYQLDFDNDGPHLLALLRHFKAVQAKNRLIATHYEVEILTDNFRGFVDVILKDVDSDKWWIGDMKTASSYNAMLHSRLHADWQLNLYAAHVNDICQKIGYKPEDFQGCRYLLAVKTKTKRKLNEPFLAFADRLYGAVSCHDIAISHEEMKTASTVDVFKRAYAEIKLIHSMKPAVAERHVAPNFNSCTTYFKPCEFWSQCYGKTFTEGQERGVISSK